MEISAKDWLTLLAMVQTLRVSLDVQGAKLSMLLDSLHERGILDYEEMSALQDAAKELAIIFLTDEIATQRFGNPRMVLQESGVTRQPPALLGEQLGHTFETLIDTAASGVMGDTDL